MNWQSFNTQLLAENVGWALIHSLWQISLIAFLLFLSLRILKNVSANVRYLFSVAALFSAVIMLAATLFSLSPNQEIGKPSGAMQSNADVRGNLLKTVDGKQQAGKAATSSADTKLTIDNRIPETEVSLRSRAESLFAEILPFFIWFWLGGVLLFSFRFCGGVWQINRLKKRRVEKIGDEWQTKFDHLCEKTGVRRTVKFLQSELTKTPMVVGWLKPLVIVPSSVLLGLNPRELETIVAHELIHIRRHDYLINIVQSFVEIVLFFHPLAWWISAQIRCERENACDDEVLKIFNSEPLLYANALANLEDFRAHNLTTPTTIVAANGGNLMMRIQRIIRKSAEKNRQRHSFWSIVPVFLVIAPILATVFLTNGQAVINSENSKPDANKKRIAVGLYSGYTQLDVERTAADENESMRRLVEKLKNLKIPLTGFVIGARVDLNSETGIAEQKKIVNLWRAANFEIGIRNYKHPQSFNASLDDYVAASKKRSAQVDLLFSEKEMQKLKDESQKYNEITQKFKNDKSFAKEKDEIMQKMQENLRRRQEIFETAEKNWREENNLIAVKYSIGAHDWIYSASYDLARRRNDRESMDRIKNEFVVYMAKIFDHYEQYSQQLFDRQVPQTFGLAPSRLVADSADELIAVIKQRGYQFVSMDEAMQDAAYQSDKLFASGVGSSWFDSVARETRRDFPDKPKVDEDVMAIWYK